MRFLIVHHDTLGLRHDARILHRALTTVRPPCSVHHIIVPGPMLFDYKTPLNLSEEITAAAPFDCTFILEHAHANDPITRSEFSKAVVYIPNIEWMSPADEEVVRSGCIWKVLLKNRYSLDIFRALPHVDHVSASTCIGWTSEDPLDRATGHTATDYNRFLHVKGISSQKQTDIVMETWAENPSFPKLTVVLRFPYGFELTQPMKYASNVDVIMREVPLSELHSLQSAAGVHVAPSLAEGFGHSLNEARAAGSILITTDAPPMNELVKNGETGLLVPVDETRSSPMKRSRWYPVTREALAVAVEKVLRLPQASREKMGRAAREVYLGERERFHANLSQALEL